MSYRHDDNLSLSGQVKDIERKPLKNELACAVIEGESIWSLLGS